MKVLISIISVILILLSGGCNETFINQPDLNSDKDSPKTALVNLSTVLPPKTREIKLCCDSYDPVSGDCKIMGVVSYLHNAIPFADSLFRVELKIELDAQLCTKLMNSLNYSIVGTSRHVIMVSPSGSAPVEKNYEIMFRPDLRLGILYKVTTSDLGISRICLYQIDTKNSQYQMNN